MLPIKTKYSEKADVPTGTEQTFCPHLQSNCLSADESAHFLVHARVIIFLFSGQHLYVIYLSSAVPGIKVVAGNLQ